MMSKRFIELEYSVAGHRLELHYVDGNGDRHEVTVHELYNPFHGEKQELVNKAGNSLLELIEILEQDEFYNENWNITRKVHNMEDD